MTIGYIKFKFISPPFFSTKFSNSKTHRPDISFVILSKLMFKAKYHSKYCDSFITFKFIEHIYAY